MSIPTTGRLAAPDQAVNNVHWFELHSKQRLQLFKFGSEDQFIFLIHHAPPASGGETRKERPPQSPRNTYIVLALVLSALCFAARNSHCRALALALPTWQNSPSTPCQLTWTPMFKCPRRNRKDRFKFVHSDQRNSRPTQGLVSTTY
jgi:hypothetical protein